VEARIRRALRPSRGAAFSLNGIFRCLSSRPQKVQLCEQAIKRLISINLSIYDCDSIQLLLLPMGKRLAAHNEAATSSRAAANLAKALVTYPPRLSQRARRSALAASANRCCA
jgi:hypothetical protein